MLEASGAATVSAHKNPPFRVSIASMMLVAIVLIGLYLVQPQKSLVCTARQDCFSVTVASSSHAQQFGLSGRMSMPVMDGMLFAFDRPGTRCFWMKDMHFDLDILWIDSQWRVSQIVSNLSPATYPRSYCVPASQYVIEINGGQAAQSGIKPGDQLNRIR